jgi:hypothetical protein
LTESVHANLKAFPQSPFIAEPEPSVVVEFGVQIKLVAGIMQESVDC